MEDINFKLVFWQILNLAILAFIIRFIYIIYKYIKNKYIHLIFITLSLTFFSCTEESEKINPDNAKLELKEILQKNWQKFCHW